MPAFGVVPVNARTNGEADTRLDDSCPNIDELCGDVPTEEIIGAGDDAVCSEPTVPAGTIDRDGHTLKFESGGYLSSIGVPVNGHGVVVGSST